MFKLKGLNKIVAKTLESTTPVLRTLQRREKELLTAWSEYADAHAKAMIREKDEEIEAASQVENEAIVMEHDEILNQLEEKIEQIERDNAGPLDTALTKKQKFEVADLQYKAIFEITIERVKMLGTTLKNLKTTTIQPFDILSQKLEKVLNEAKEELDDKHKEVISHTEAELVKEVESKHFDQRLFLTKAADTISSDLVMKISEIKKAEDTDTIANALNAVQLERRPESQGAGYKAYAKESMPTFEGKLRQYPGWRKEMRELVLPNLKPTHQIRILDKHSPDTVDLQNCTTVQEAWKELDSKFGNAANITTVLMDDFFKAKLKCKSEESKFVELKTLVARLSSDLVAVEQSQVLHDNPYAISNIVKLMPRFWQNKFSESKPKLQENGETLWEAVLGFLKNESFRLETELPWTLDSLAEETKEEDATSERWKRRVNVIKKEDRVKRAEAKKSPRYDEMTEKFGKCPHCDVHHNFVGRYNELMATDNIRNCDSFFALTPQQRAVVVQQKRICALCLSWSHERSECVQEKKICGVRQCALLHNSLLHGSTIGYVNLARGKKIAEIEEKGEDQTVKFLHMVSHKFKTKNLRLVFLLDDGSDICLITLKAAGYLGLRGQKKMTYLMTAGAVEAEGKIMIHYSFQLETNEGSIVTINCIGVESITENSNSYSDLGPAYAAFPHIPTGALARPHDEVGILLGQDQAALLASGGRGEDLVGNLRAMRTSLGTGWVLGGWSPEIVGTSVSISSSANLLRQARVVTSPRRVNLIKNTDTWIELEDLSCQLPRRCTRCKSCQSCRHEAQEATAEEQRELELLKKAITYDQKRKRCTVSYPILGDLSALRNNEWQAVAMASSLERQMKKKGKLECYNSEFEDYLARGVLEEVSKEEIRTWEKNGRAINFISHHGVETPHKATTKTRLVSNPSIRNGGKGPSVNDLWPKGPLSLQPMIEVFIRFRGYEVACHYDIRKMYHSVFTTEDEKYLRLLVWRLSEGDWRYFGYAVVAMGDRPAACILELVKDVAAKEGEEIDEATATKIKEDTYVDDGCTGGSEEEVQRMIGEVQEEDDGSLKYSGTVQQILSRVSFKIKMMVRSGEQQNSLALEKMGGMILGHCWDPMKDVFTFQPKVYLGKKVRGGIHEGPELTIQTLSLLEDYLWTRRTVLSTIAGIFDPAGLIAPYTMKFKLFLREVCLSGGAAWDEALSEELQAKWRKLVKELICSEPIIIPRAAKAKGSVGESELVVYSDGSLIGYCACVYLRQKINNKDLEEEWSSSLLLAKSRIAPLTGITPPRSEMNGFVTAIRLTTLAMRSLKEKPVRVRFILDSECTI